MRSIIIESSINEKKNLHIYCVIFAGSVLGVFGLNQPYYVFSSVFIST